MVGVGLTLSLNKSRVCDSGYHLKVGLYMLYGLG